MFGRFREVCTTAPAAVLVAATIVSSSGAGELARCAPFQGDAQPLVAPADPEFILGTLKEDAYNHSGAIQLDAGWLPQLPLDVKVGRAWAIVRGTMAELNDEHLVCNTGRGQVLSGRIVGDRVYGHRSDGRPHPRRFPEARFQKGRRVILFLDNCRRINGGTEARIFGITIEQPGERSLNRVRQDILTALGRGSYLMPKPSDVEPFIRSSDAIVRARLRKIEERSTEWEVLGEPLFVAPSSRGRGHFDFGDGTDPSGTQPRSKPQSLLTLSLDPWWARANAIVWNTSTISSLEKPGVEYVRPPVISEFVEPVFQQIVKKDFTVGREAILFVALCKQRDGKLNYRFVGILYGDPDRPKHLDELSERIQRAVQSGDPWARRA